MESSFTPRYARLVTLESGCPNSEYWCEVGLVLCVIGTCTHFDILNCNRYNDRTVPRAI